MSQIDTSTSLRQMMLSNIRNQNAAGIYVPNVKGKEPEKDYNTLYAFDSNSVKEAKLESWIAKSVGERLMTKFPQREWGVKVDMPNQIVIIICESVSITRGYHIHMVGKSLHDIMEQAEGAAAEILERHGLTRDRKYNADITEAMIRDHNGDMIGGDNG